MATMFCKYYGTGQPCQTPNCRDAHCREELTRPILSHDEECAFKSEQATTEQVISLFKVFWCPYPTRHDFHRCPYAHNYHDARRPPALGYECVKCPEWRDDASLLPYHQRCPNGLRCPKTHGAKELLYHRAMYKTVSCKNPHCDTYCCAFAHSGHDRRKAARKLIDDYTPLEPLSEALVHQLVDIDSFATVRTRVAKPPEPRDTEYAAPPPPMHPPQGHTMLHGEPTPATTASSPPFVPYDMRQFSLPEPPMRPPRLDPSSPVFQPMQTPSTATSQYTGWQLPPRRDSYDYPAQPHRTSSAYSQSTAYPPSQPPSRLTPPTPQSPATRDYGLENDLLGAMVDMVLSDDDQPMSI